MKSTQANCIRMNTGKSIWLIAAHLATNIYSLRMCIIIRCISLFQMIIFHFNVFMALIWLQLFARQPKTSYIKRSRMQMLFSSFRSCFTNDIFKMLSNNNNKTHRTSDVEHFKWMQQKIYHSHVLHNKSKCIYLIVYIIYSD